MPHHGTHNLEVYFLFIRIHARRVETESDGVNDDNQSDQELEKPGLASRQHHLCSHSNECLVGYMLGAWNIAHSSPSLPVSIL